MRNIFRRALVCGGLLASLGALGANKKPLDVTEPPFGAHDYSWMNGSNRQPPSLLTTGPITFQLYVDTFYAFQFSKPADHTIFPSTVASRHNDLAINLAAIGLEVTGLDGPIGRVYLQGGTQVEADGGQDTTTNKGYYLTNRNLMPIQQAAGGWHFHDLHGINVEFGLFPSYMGLESYLPQEDWNYTHAFMSDFTPYYFSGSRTQLFFTQDFKLELWLVNGWQTFGHWYGTLAGGYLVNWRPSGKLSLTNSVYLGRENAADPGSFRYYSDNQVQYRYFEGGPHGIKSSALCVVADIGYEKRSNAESGIMTGYSFANRIEFNSEWAFTGRADYYYDKTQAVILQLPLPLPGQSPINGGNPYTFPHQAFSSVGLTTTLDFLPSPWIMYRLEYAYRRASFPYFSGAGGLSATPPDLRDHDHRIIANVTLRL